MINGYGAYGQVWSLPTRLLDRGTLNGYAPCTACVTGLGSVDYRARSQRRKQRIGHLQEKLGKCRGRVGRMKARISRLKARCPRGAGLGADWEDVDDAIDELYLGGFGNVDLEAELKAVVSAEAKKCAAAKKDRFNPVKLAYCAAAKKLVTTKQEELKKAAAAGGAGAKQYAMYAVGGVGAIAALFFVAKRLGWV